MNVHHLNCGTLCPPGGRLINDTGSSLSGARLVCHCLLVETDRGLVLVDTGIGLADIDHPEESLGQRFLRRTRPRLDPAETALHQVRGLGYTAEDVRHIVLTHLHRDHAGGLPDFPHATVHVHRTEFEAAMRPATKHELARYSPTQWAHEPRWATYPTDGDRWYGFDAVRSLDGLPADILLIPLHGHSRGHTGVAVRTGTSGGGPEWLLHAGDAYFHHTELHPTRPRTPPGLALFQTTMQIDRTGRRRNQARLRQLVAEHNGEVTIFSAHDPNELPQKH